MKAEEIFLRALEKDRTRRYETAMDLARDIGRHLRLEPVEARPASRFYRLSKLVQRNKLACGAATMVLLSLIAGIAFSTWMYRRERLAHEAAQAAQMTAVDEADIKEAVSRFLMDDVKEQQARIPPEARDRLRWALEHLVALHEKKGDAAGVKHWQSELETMDAASR
jgi:hypothetical protein